MSDHPERGPGSISLILCHWRKLVRPWARKQYGWTLFRCCRVIVPLRLDMHLPQTPESASAIPALERRGVVRQCEDNLLAGRLLLRSRLHAAQRIKRRHWRVALLPSLALHDTVLAAIVVSQTKTLASTVRTPARRANRNVPRTLHTCRSAGAPQLKRRLGMAALPD